MVGVNSYLAAPLPQHSRVWFSIGALLMTRSDPPPPEPPPPPPPPLPEPPPADPIAGLNLPAAVLQATDSALEAAVLISLFTDRRADAGDGRGEHGGYWADAFERDGRRTGSRLWVLQRKGLGPKTAQEARAAASEALEWLLVHRIAKAVDVDAVVKENAVIISVAITRPGDLAPRWQRAWEMSLAL